MKMTSFSLLNGNLVHATRAALPVADRGFRFGDGVFETIRIQNHVPYQWELHQRRLFDGLRALYITPPLDDFTAPLKKLLKKNSFKNGYARIAISRGVGSRGYAPYPPSMPATWLIELLPEAETVTKPYQLWLSQIAKIPLQCLPTNQKLAQGINSTLALMEAHTNSCEEALQLTIEGFIAEAASANIFWFSNDTLTTPALDTGCLNGTTREAILRLSPYPVRMVKAGVAELAKAKAVFITNTRLGVHPIASLEPLGLAFQPTHRIIKLLARKLKDDRAAYVTRNKKHWAPRG